MKRIVRFVSSSGYAFPSFLAAAIGIITGVLAVGFIKAIAGIHFVGFMQGRDFFASLGPYYVIFLPALGGLLVGPLVTFLRPKPRGTACRRFLRR